ncbi:hypothetical protein HK100_010550 [Physocladia obscura]|uniref:Major facilitator superfamily (MFS) profile domain-containing protein n=1 Tax=Physocladia obscura TaxID=109957 RepID=A0AAD5T8D9_9FUNG|nr:hypothetical protein HK100_010550 [Physocladia obscura]
MVAEQTDVCVIIEEGGGIIEIAQDMNNIWVAFVLVICVGLASLDTAVVASALKAIVGELGAEPLVPFVGSSYLIGTAAVGALYGKLAGVFGRRAALLGAVVLFALGSLLSAAAPSMPFLVFGRAVCGLGGGGLFTMAYIIMADVFVPSIRGKYQAVLSTTYGVSSAIAPLIGGILSDRTSWRWCFYINLPAAILLIPAVFYFIRLPVPSGSFTEKLRRIDFLGTALIFTVISTLVTALQLGGSYWAWNSPPIILLFIITAIILFIFVIVQMYIATEPIIPATIFVNSSVTAILISSICIGATSFPALYYLALFFQLVNNDNATDAGVKTIPYVIGFIVMSFGTGFLISNTGKYKLYFFIGSVFTLIGLAFTARFNSDTSITEKLFVLVVLGFGIGVLTSIRMLAIQFSVPKELIAIASGVTQTMGTLGGSIGIAISGTIFNNEIIANIESNGILNSAMLSLIEQGYIVDPTEVLAFSNLLTAVPALVINGTEANSQLIQAFTDSYRVAYFSLFIYPIAILIAAVGFI